MDNLEKLQSTTSHHYKHSIEECAVKLNGIKHLLDQIAKTSSQHDSKYMAESAQELCNELLRELK